MKTNVSPLFFVVFLLLPACMIAQQNVGIGVNKPTQALSVARGLNIDHENLNDGTSLLNGLQFGNAEDPTQMVGISSNRVIGSNKYSLDFYTRNTLRLRIAPNGYVGINTEIGSYMFEVGGTIRGYTIRSAGNVIAEGGGVNASSYVEAGAFIRAQGNITSSNGNIVATNGVLQADGKGEVMSSNANRQRIVTYIATLSATNLPPGGSVTGTLSIGAGTFNAAPTAYVGNVVTKNGDYYKAMLVLENVTTTSITVRLVNVAPTNITIKDAQWRIMVYGTY